MIYYHGTVKVYLPSILKQGLKPRSGNQWKAVRPTSFLEEIYTGNSFANVEDSEDLDYIYLAVKKNPAEKFARLRAKYMQAKPGETVSVPTLVPLVKQKDAPVVVTHPVVLRVTLPDNAEVSADDAYYGAFRFHGVIFPEQIEVMKGAI